MKYLSYILLCCLPFLGKAQQKFSISGDIKNVKGSGKVYLALVQDGRYANVDSAIAKNGKFKFTGQLAYPQNALLNLRRQDNQTKKLVNEQLGLFLENSKIKVNGVGSLKDAKVFGSKTNEERLRLDAQINPITQKIIKIQNEFIDKKKEDLYVDGKMLPYAAQAADSMRSHIEQIKNLNIDFVKSHSNSFYAMDVFMTKIIGNKFDPAVAEPIFEGLSEELKNSTLGLQAKNKIQVAKRMTVGRQATDFIQKDVHDQDFTLSSLRGKYVFVDFWASWCGPCRLENPHVVKAYEELKGDNFEIVSVSLDQNKEAWKNAIQQDNLPWIHVSDLKGWKNKVAILYGINSVPQNFLINPEGVIVAQNLRGEELTNKIKQHIK